MPPGSGTPECSCWGMGLRLVRFADGGCSGEICVEGCAAAQPHSERKTLRQTPVRGMHTLFLNMKPPPNDSLYLQSFSTNGSKVEKSAQKQTSTIKNKRSRCARLRDQRRLTLTTLPLNQTVSRPTTRATSVHPQTTLVSMDSLCSRLTLLRIVVTLVPPHRDVKAATGTSVSSGNHPSNK